jgi:hypothetical protein
MAFEVGLREAGEGTRGGFTGNNVETLKTLKRSNVENVLWSAILV